MNKIKAYVGVNEYNKIRKYRDFEVVKSISIDNIVFIFPIEIDVENNQDCFNYDYYEVQVFDKESYDYDEKENQVTCEADYIDTYYYAIERGEI